MSGKQLKMRTIVQIINNFEEANPPRPPKDENIEIHYNKLRSIVDEVILVEDIQPLAIRSEPSEDRVQNVCEEVKNKHVPKQFHEIYEEILKRDASSTVSKFASGQTISVKGLASIKGNRWLNDEAINSFLELIINHANQQSQDGYHDNIYMSSFYFSNLTGNGNGYNPGRVCSWLDGRARKTRINLFLYNKVFLPINVGGVHWVLVMIKPQDRIISFFDSFRGKSISIMLLIFGMLQEHYARNDKTDEEWESWSLEDCSFLCPYQEDCHQCGVHTLMRADCLARGKGVHDIWYENSDVEKYREFIAACLINKTYITDDEDIKPMDESHKNFVIKN